MINEYRVIYSASKDLYVILTMPLLCILVFSIIKPIARIIINCIQDIIYHMINLSQYRKLAHNKCIDDNFKQLYQFSFVKFSYII